ncbi:MAG TPA: nuclear transport factor 2 family protein [Streptosporangiaceae bacterium]|jgi:ketosteroid isomerase-like protein|nr:nuclear transport factor 2 family protein [Streptosporangiaceae bacterium]
MGIAGRRMNNVEIEDWVAAYERAWRSPGTQSLAAIFTEDATYQQGPYDPVLTGLPAIAAMWEAQRDGPDEAFRMSRGVVAVDGGTAVVRVEVDYGEPVRQQYRDLWIMRFAADGRCAAFEEWPFWPEHGHAAP